MRSDPFDEVLDRELRVRSMAAFAAGLGLVLSAIGGVIVWLVLTFPVGAAGDIAGEAAKVAGDTAVIDACSKASASSTTSAPPVPGTPTTTTLPLPCSVRP